MAGSLANPSPEQLEGAFAKYQGSDPPGPASDSPAEAPETSADPWKSDPGLIALDKALAEQNRHAGLGRGEPEPEPETAIRMSPEEAARLEREDHEVYAEFGTSGGELAQLIDANPDLVGLLDAKAETQDDVRRAVATFTNLVAGRQAQSALSNAQADAVLEDALEVLEESEEDWERVQAANELASLAPERLGQFLESWREVEPFEPDQWIGAKQQQEAAARQNVQALANAMATASFIKQEHEREKEVGAAFADAIAQVSASLNQRGKEKLGGYFTAALQELATEQQIDSQDMARAATAMALQQAREVEDAQQTAKTLTGIDEYIHRQKMGSPDWQPFNRNETLARNFNDQFFENRERIVQAGADAVGPREKPEWLENLDAFAKGEKSRIDFGR